MPSACSHWRVRGGLFDGATGSLMAPGQTVTWPGFRGGVASGPVFRGAVFRGAVFRGAVLAGGAVASGPLVSRGRTAAVAAARTVRQVAMLMIPALCMTVR